MKIAILSLFIAILFFLNSCSDDEPTQSSNSAPGIPYNPSPENNSWDTFKTVTLSWDCTDPDNDPLVYSVYFDTTSDPRLRSENQSLNSYNIAPLELNRIYYWKIKATDNNQKSTIGPIWSFSLVSRPDSIIMVKKNSDMDTIESGIDAVPDTDGIFIQWYLLNDPNIETYNIYRKTKNESYFYRIATIPVEGVISPFDTTFFYIDADANLILNNNEYTYYYYVTAINEYGLEGSLPNKIEGYLLLSKPITNTTPDITIYEQPILEWSYQYLIPNDYIIRIENSWTEELLWTKQFQTQDFVWDVVIDLSSLSSPPIYQSGTTYRWRIDAMGPDPLFSGSESEWKTFTVQ